MDNNVNVKKSNGIPEKLLRPYNPTETEARIYKLWEESGFFNPDVCIEKGVTKPDAKPFAIIMPPPNSNGRLHAGHGLDMTLKDIIIRFKRMQGYKSLFVPGADHAGFETQIVYEKKLEKEGKSRFDFTSEELYAQILTFTLENKKFMEDDVKRLGTSCDWSREKFTLDPSVITEVHKTFKKMYDDGLVYRGNRIVNWCARHQTSLSDVETTSKDQKDPFYYFKYGPFTIGTARPETKFGDKYVVIHPHDKRYDEYKHGQKIEVEWINGPITATIIKDEAIDMEFGTGVMTITPWHSGIDFDIAKRHNLDMEQIIDWNGKLLPIAEEFSGIHIKKARPLIVEKLAKKGLLVKTDEDYIHAVPVCYKCETPIEPQVRPQWFVKMQPLAKLALEPVSEGKIEFYPDNFRKIYEYWMNNTIDWNISRQIIWGINIPAKICTACGEGFPDLEDKITICPSCGGSVMKDTDTFDTWFSSGQWPLLTLNYPDSLDFKTYYPTNLMETGRDLIFKWIPRMVIFGMYLAKETPFKDVYLHGMVNDEKNQKMSKSKGNVISPITLCDEFGADATRMALVVGNSPGNDMALSKSKIKGYKNFANKIWNISRFVLESSGTSLLSKPDKISEKDEVCLKEAESIFKDITADLENYRFHLASEKLYHYIWHTFADIIIEESKSILAGDNDADKLSRLWLLQEILRRSVKTLHPFMPFVTEELWSLIPHDGKNLLMVSSWPTQ